MQASVHTVAEDGSGTALLDDGRVVSFPAEVLRRSGLRHLRPGQRVSIVLGREPGVISRLWIVGIGQGERIR